MRTQESRLVLAKRLRADVLRIKRFSKEGYSERQEQEDEA